MFTLMVLMEAKTIVDDQESWPEWIFPLVHFTSTPAHPPTHFSSRVTG
jgi:hypothetical protein